MVFKILTNFNQYDIPYWSYHQITFCEQCILKHRPNCEGGDTPSGDQKMGGLPFDGTEEDFNVLVEDQHLIPAQCDAVGALQGGAPQGQGTLIGCQQGGAHHEPNCCEKIIQNFIESHNRRMYFT